MEGGKPTPPRCHTQHVLSGDKDWCARRPRGLLEGDSVAEELPFGQRP